MRKTTNKKANVQMIVKKILGLENVKTEDLSHKDLKNMWAVQSCFRKTNKNGRVGSRFGYHYGKGMDLIAKYFA